MTRDELSELIELFGALLWAGVQVAFWGLLLVGFIVAVV
jgi:hypothetical protein